MEKGIYDTIIVGSGPAGLTAAIYNVRADLKTVVIGGNQPGGQLTITTYVDNYPGFPNGIGGVKLMMDMMAQVKNLGVEIKNGMVKGIVKDPVGGVFRVEMDDGNMLNTRAVIVATGARAKWLGLPKEKELIGKGVSGCATCDGMFFRGKVVAVVGGGDTACEDAVFLAKFASRVLMIHRRDSFRASPIEQKKVFENKKIEIVWDSVVEEINCGIPLGSEVKLENIIIKNNKSGEIKVVEVDGLFVAVGNDPATGFLKGVVELTADGHLVVGNNRDFPTMTTTEGIFAAGDCADEIYRQAIVAAGEGCKAGLDAERWLKYR